MGEEDVRIAHILCCLGEEEYEDGIGPSAKVTNYCKMNRHYYCISNINYNVDKIVGVQKNIMMSSLL